ncbi:MAG: hypothetical protein QM831_24825 [Kofleriaceae bacterium]
MKQIKRRRQRGSAMLVTMIVITSLLAGAAVLVSMQLASNRSTDLTRTGLEATYCAEAGLNAAMPQVMAHPELWATALTECGGVYPCIPEQTIFTGVSHSVDYTGSGSDYMLYIRDNDDEYPPAPLDPLHDSDLRVFIVSRCTKYGDTIKEVEALVEYTGGGSDYRMQQGLGGFGTGNAN